MGLSSVFSNPILLAAAAVVAIGVVLYEVIQHHQEKHSHRGRGSSSPPRLPPSPPPSPKRPKKNPISKGDPSKKSDASYELRKRNCNQTSPKTDSSEVKPLEVQKPASLDVKENSSKNDNCHERNQSFKADDSKVDNNIFNENNYERNVFDKIVNDTKDIEKIVESRGSLVKNISDAEDSDSDSENNLPPRNEEKLVNIVAFSGPGQNCDNSNNVPQTPPSDELLFSENPALEESIESLSSCLDSDEELLYKGKVANSLKSDVERKAKFQDESPGCSSLESSVGAASNDNLSNFSQLTEPTECRGCEENPVNTRIHPCNHRYLCVDCAHRVFRIYKKCIICHSEITEFVEI